jgi:hypothetical protein
VHGINDLRQAEMNTVKPLVPEPNSFEDESSTEKLKKI